MPFTQKSWSESDLEDYLNELDAALRQAETSIQTLNNDPEQVSAIHGLFRCIHSIKSNAAMHYLTPLVNFTAAVEDVVSSLRSKQLVFSPPMGEAILLALDRIKWVGPDWLAQHSADSFLPENVLQAFRALASAENTTERDDKTTKLLRHLGVKSPTTSNENHILIRPADDILCTHASPKRQADLRFFRQLSLQLEERAPYWDGRTGRLAKLAYQTNEMAGKPVDPVQLEAAVYMHDIGMTFLSESIWTKHGKLTDREMKELRRHPSLGAGLMARMPGREGAAKIVEQHHERLDGTGYPLGLTDQNILHGAKLIAVLDAFEAMTHQRIDRQYKKSIMRAMGELNACDQQFSQEWVQIFNKVIHSLLAHT